MVAVILMQNFRIKTEAPKFHKNYTDITDEYCLMLQKDYSRWLQLE